MKQPELNRQQVLTPLSSLQLLSCWQMRKSLQLRSRLGRWKSQ